MVSVLLTSPLACDSQPASMIAILVDFANPIWKVLKLNSPLSDPQDLLHCSVFIVNYNLKGSLEELHRNRNSRVVERSSMPVCGTLTFARTLNLVESFGQTDARLFTFPLWKSKNDNLISF